MTLIEGRQPVAGGRRACDEGRLTVSAAGAADDWWRVVARPGWDYCGPPGQHVVIEGLQPPR